MFLDTGTGSPRRSRRVEAAFDHAAVVLGDGWSDHVEVTHQDPAAGRDGAEQVDVGAELPLRRELDAFARYLAGGPTPRSSLDEAAESVAMIERLLR